MGGVGAAGAPAGVVDVGCECAPAPRHQDAEWCFRRAADLGDPLGSFNLAIALRAQHRDVEAVAAYEAAIDRPASVCHTPCRPR